MLSQVQKQLPKTELDDILNWIPAIGILITPLESSASTPNKFNLSIPGPSMFFFVGANMGS